jgi:CHAT domain-containing protein
LSLSLSGQCPDRDSIMKRLGDRATIRTALALKTLLSYESRSQNCFAGNDSVMRKVYEAIGLCYYEQRNFLASAQYIRKAIDESRKPTNNNAHRLSKMAEYYYFLCVFYDSLGNRASQMEATDSCIAIEKKLDDRYYFSTFLIADKVHWLFNKGDFKQCVTYSDFGETLVQRNLHGRDSTKFLLFILTYKAQSLLFMGNATEAEALVRNSISDGVKQDVNSSLGVMYSLAGQIYAYNNKFDEAIISYQNALRANKKYKFRKGCAENLTNIATYLNDNFSKPDSAFWYAKLALKYADGVDSLVAFDIMGNVMVKKQRFKDAFEYFNLALNQLGIGMHVNDILTIAIDKKFNEKSTEYVTNLAIHYGSACLAQYKAQGNLSSLDKAIEIFTTTDQFISRIRSQHFELETKLYWRGYSRRLYEKAIEACYLRSDSEIAFRFFERSRAVLLNDDLHFERLMSENDLMAQADLQAENVYLQQQLSSLEKGSDEIRVLQQKIYDNTIHKESLDQKIKSYIVNYSAEDPLSDINAVRTKILPNHNALIEIFVGDSSVYIFSILKNKNAFVKIDKSLYTNLTNHFLAGLSKPFLFESDFENFVDISHKLYKLVFGATEIPPGRIIVSPDGSHFPFEALVISNDKNNIRYLINEYAVSYSYSAGYLVNNKRQTPSQSKVFMGIAPVYYGASLKLTPLMGSDRSLKTIGKEFSEPNNYYSVTANRHNFLNNFYKYKIIHLYSHASANAVTGNPVLFFADSALYLNDLILRERPVTSLVVLAACESGVGKFYSGEGVFSFNRAFASFGIPTALVNLWPVDNKTTYELSESFYENIVSGMDLDVALQKAKLQYLATATGEKRLPYYWAPGVITGRSESILLSNQHNYNRWTIMTLLLVTAFLVFSIMWGRGSFRFISQSRLP